MLVRIRPLLEQLERLDIAEEMLALLGVQEMSRDEAERYLAQAADAFDLAVTIRKTPHPFQHKLHAHLRPYLVDSSAQMIRNGFHREALAWITPCLCSATDVILADGFEADKHRFAGNRDALLRAIGSTIPTPASGSSRRHGPCTTASSPWPTISSLVTRKSGTDRRKTQAACRSNRIAFLNMTRSKRTSSRQEE